MKVHLAIVLSVELTENHNPKIKDVHVNMDIMKEIIIHFILKRMEGLVPFIKIRNNVISVSIAL